MHFLANARAFRAPGADDEVAAQGQLAIVVGHAL